MHYLNKNFFSDFIMESVKISYFDLHDTIFTLAEEGYIVMFVKNHKDMLEITEKGMETFHKLLAQADVFVTNTRPAGLKRLGIYYDDLKEKYPALIYAIILGYGEKGPDKDMPAFDVTAFWSKGGFLRDMAPLNDQYAPVNAPSSVGDTATGYLLLAEISTALYNRERTGKGDYVRSTLFRNGIFTMGTMAIIAQKPFGYPYPRTRIRVGAPGGSYRCADGEWIFIATGDPLKNFPAIHRIIGRPDLTESRLQMDREEYYGIIRDAMLTKPAAEWIRLGNAEDIPIVPMNHFSDISEECNAPHDRIVLLIDNLISNPI